MRRSPPAPGRRCRPSSGTASLTPAPAAYAAQPPRDQGRRLASRASHAGRPRDLFPRWSNGGGAAAPRRRPGVDADRPGSLRSPIGSGPIGFAAIGFAVVRASAYLSPLGADCRTGLTRGIEVLLGKAYLSIVWPA